MDTTTSIRQADPTEAQRSETTYEPPAADTVESQSPQCSF